MIDSGGQPANGTLAQPLTGFAMCRILGNSLPPRHGTRNTINTLAYILAHEEEFPDVRKIWILNRLVDEAEASEFRSMIAAKGHEIVEIPFNAKGHYESFLDVSGLPKPFEIHDHHGLGDALKPLSFEWMIRHKSQQIVNLNLARNVALRHGRSIARWVLPLDGGVMFHAKGWAEFVRASAHDSSAKFIIIPMARALSHAAISSVTLKDAEGEEPHIAFRHDTQDLFDERLRYGNRNKTALFQQIGLAGPWDNWLPTPWDRLVVKQSADRGRYIKAGLVVRLPTEANTGVEKSANARWLARFQGVEDLSAKLDAQEAVRRFDAEQVFHSYAALRSEHAEGLEQLCAKLAKERVITILEKPTVAPSGDVRDFICPPRYPNPGDNNTLALDSDHYDRHIIGLDRFLRHSSILAYGGHVLGNAAYVRKAAAYLQIWMIDEKTRMNPHLHYAQFAGKGAAPSAFGIVVARDLWLLPQTIRLLEASGAIEPDIVAKLNWWIKQLLRGFIKSPQFQAALGSQNNISTWAAVIVASLALHLGELESTMPIVRNAMVRFTHQMGPLNIQHHEMKRDRQLHYSLFNLAGWCALAAVFRRVGCNLVAYEGREGESLLHAIETLSRMRDRFKDYRENPAEFDQRIAVTAAILQGKPMAAALTSPFMLDRNWGFAPLWPAFAPD
jgi:hypothetical protein